MRTLTIAIGLSLIVAAGSALATDGESQPLTLTESAHYRRLANGELAWIPAQQRLEMRASLSLSAAHVRDWLRSENLSMADDLTEREIEEYILEKALEVWPRD